MYRFSRTILLALVFLLVTAGLLMLYSTTYATRGTSQLNLQLGWVGITIVAILVLWKTDYHLFCKYSVLFLCLAWIPLAYLAGIHFLDMLHCPQGILHPLAFLTKKVNGAYRWLELGPIRIQPSEFVKVCLILFLAQYFSRNARHITQGGRGIWVWLTSFRETLESARASMRPLTAWAFALHKTLRHGVLLPIAVSVAVAGTILLGGSLSVATITAGVVIAITFVAGVRLRWFIPVILILAVALPVVPVTVFFFSLPDHRNETPAAHASAGYGRPAAAPLAQEPPGTLVKIATSVLGEARTKRFLYSWRDPESQAKTVVLDTGKKEGGGGYQLWMSILALGSGDWTGLGFTESRMKKFYLPEAHTDFIVAVIGEELGLVAVLLLIAAYTVLVGTCFWMATQAADKEGVLLCTGIGASFGLHAFFNIAVVSGFIPTTGITAPFVSYGGSNVLASGIGIGLLLSVSRHAERLRLERAAQQQPCCVVPNATPQRLFSENP